jgi:hypothetical protein
MCYLKTDKLRQEIREHINSIDCEDYIRAFQKETHGMKYTIEGLQCTCGIEIGFEDHEKLFCPDCKEELEDHNYDLDNENDELRRELESQNEFITLMKRLVYKDEKTKEVKIDERGFFSILSDKDKEVIFDTLD